MKILIVDDSIHMLEVMELIFSDENYKILMAINGNEALKLMESQSFDLVITDLNMPGMNGVVLAGHLRKRYPHLPMVLFSSDMEVSKIYDEDLAAIGNTYFVGDKDFEKLSETVAEIRRSSLT